MTINTTLWSPDTCACVIEYQWDDTQPAETRTHTISRIVNKCSAHSATANNTAHWNVLMDENPRKNLTIGTALSTLSSQLGQTDPRSGSLVLKDGISFNYSWSGTSPNRILTITFTGVTLTTAQKNTLQTAIDNRLGAGKVIVG